MSDQPSDEWIEHDGGPCPVDPESTVTAKFRRGNVAAYCLRARLWVWPHDGGKHDIVAYRVVKP